MRQSIRFCGYILLTVFSAFNVLLAQDTPTKELIYTLQAGEKIGNFENSLGVYQSGLGYMVVVENVDKATRKYLVNKSVYEGFERPTIEIPRMNDFHWGFVDSKKDSNWVVFDGNNIQKFPSFKHTTDIHIAKNLRAFVIYNETLSEYHLVVNEVTYGPYANLINYLLSPEGTNWGVIYFENVGAYYNYYVKFSNGKVLGPFSKIHDFDIMNENGWVLVAERRDSPKKVVNGKSIDQLVIITHKGELGYFEKDLIGKDYYNHRKLLSTHLNYGMNVIREQQIYYMVNGELFGPYDDFVKQADLGIKPNRFNYVVGSDNTLYFRGEKSFAKNVRKFTVSDSRNSVAIVKMSDSSPLDTLTINDKYFVGTYKDIMDITFVPNSENFYFWTKNGDNTYTLHTYINSKVTSQKAYNVKPDNKGKLPVVSFSPSMRHWGFVYENTGSSQQKIVIDGKEYASGFINEVALYANAGKEYASWISLDSGKDIVLNKLGL